MNPFRRTALLGGALLPWSWYAVRDLHAMFDWVAVLLPALVALPVAGALVVAVLWRVGWALALAAAWSAFGLLAVLLPWSPASTVGPTSGLRLAAANVRGDNPTSARVAQDLLALEADVLVVSELTPLHEPAVQRLDQEYSHSVRSSADAGVGIWSRYPLEDEPPAPATLPEAARALRTVVQGPAGPFVLYGLHLYRPSRDAFRTELTMPEHHDLVDRIDEVASAEDLPVVLAGDLNLTDRGSAFRRLRQDRVDAMRSSWTGPTSLRTRNRPLLLRIDHLLLPSGWCATADTRRALTGSDHRAVAAEVGPC